MFEKSLGQGLVHGNRSVSVSWHYRYVLSTGFILAHPAQSQGDCLGWGWCCSFDHSPLGAPSH